MIDLAQGTNSQQKNKAGAAASNNPVTKVEAIALARKYGMEYFETCSVGEASIV